MKHLLFWTYFAIVSYFIFSLNTHVTSESLVEQAKKECESTPELDGQRMYCGFFFIKEECEKGLDLRICGRLEKR